MPQASKVGIIPGTTIGLMAQAAVDFFKVNEHQSGTIPLALENTIRGSYKPGSFCMTNYLRLGCSCSQCKLDKKGMIAA